MEILLEYGTPGVVAYILFLFGRLAAPVVQSYLPGLVASRDKREDRIIAALENNTKVMAETVSTLQSMRGEMDQVRAESSELRLDVQFIAQHLEIPRARRRARKEEAVAAG